MAMKKLQHKLNDRQKVICEMVAADPYVSINKLVDETGIPRGTIRAWRRHPVFIDAVYDRYMEIAGKNLPKVLMALTREALEGNVKAIELLLKHHKKLDNTLTINHKIEAPFNAFLKSEGLDAEQAEIVLDEIEADFEVLPERNIINDTPRIREEAEAKRVRRVSNKRKPSAKRTSARDRARLRARAEAVGLEPLGAGRPSKTQRADWIAELTRLENKMKKALR